MVPAQVSPLQVAMEEIFDACWPLARSLTGEGVRQTHDIIARHVPLRRHEIASGTQVLDWTIPNEWTVRQAYVIAPDGRRILDFGENNLHLVGYSVPYQGVLSLQDLQAHLHSRPETPDAIPYVTSYYRERWGFCISDRERRNLANGDYKVVVDTQLSPGSLTISDSILEGKRADEVLISTYTCHPSMANDQLSGIIVAIKLWQRINAWRDRNLTYRFVFLPETIGSLAYLNMNGDHLMRNMCAGFVVALVGGSGPFTYRRSRRGDSLADRAAELYLETCGVDYDVVDFDPSRGNDQRQYCSPGFDLPVGCLTHTPMKKTEEYHSSLDNKDRLSFAAMEKCLDAYEAICRSIDDNSICRSTKPYGEPHMGRYGLYDDLGASGTRAQSELQDAMMWILNWSDGKHDLLAIARRAQKPFPLFLDAAGRLKNAGLIECDGAVGPLSSPQANN
jgi:aminopeptidase-like protein